MEWGEHSPPGPQTQIIWKVALWAREAGPFLGQQFTPFSVCANLYS